MTKQAVTICKTENKGVGVFATKNIKMGEIVVCGKILYKLKQRTMHSLQIAKDTHIQLDKISRSMNHSCDPNTGVQDNISGGYNFIALRTIKRGEEITWDYETTEYISISVKKCLCGTDICRESLRGFKFSGEMLREKYGDYVANYLKAEAFQE